ncbi:MAG: DUF5615 family PIN-like protein [Deltaproteobacteria bacterium]|nr:DUF5615 family PIN-like protein [Deltaproteobacteria bacterium]
MKILVDENVSTALINKLRDRGHVVSSTIGLGLAGAEDQWVLTRAVREGAIILASDKEFSRLLQFPGANNPQPQALLVTVEHCIHSRLMNDVILALEVLQTKEGDEPFVAMLEGDRILIQIGTGGEA